MFSHGRCWITCKELISGTGENGYNDTIKNPAITNVSHKGTENFQSSCNESLRDDEIINDYGTGNA